MTLKTLTDAIRSRVDEGMEENVAESIAEHALGFFGFSNRIIDNALEPTDRNLFYQLQDYELLTTESEETTLWDGREWRIHYWKFKPKRVSEIAHRTAVEEEVDPYAGLYERCQLTSGESKLDSNMMTTSRSSNRPHTPMV